MVDDRHRRQCRPARDLGLHRARRDRVPTTACKRQFPACASRLGPACGGLIVASASSTSPSPGRRRRWTVSPSPGSTPPRASRASPSRVGSERSCGAGTDRSSSTTGSRSTQWPVRPGPRAPGGLAEARDRRVAGRAVRPRAPLRRLHGGRPRAPRLLERLGGRRPGEPRRRGLPRPRRGGGAARRAQRPGRQPDDRLRPRRRAASRRRQPQRVARPGGVPRLRDRRRGRGPQAPRRRARAAPAPAGALRYAAKQRLPKLRDAGAGAQRLQRPRLVADAGAFSYGTFGNIVLNVRGREAKGVVEPGDEYERVRDEIAARLARAARARRRARSWPHVHRRENLFHGPELDKVPDLLVEFDRYAWLGKGNLKTRGRLALGPDRDRGRSEHSYVGSHRHEGDRRPRRAGRGRRGAPLRRARRRRSDAALPPRRGDPDDLEGRVLFEALRPELLDERPPEYDDTAPAEYESERAELEDEGAAEVERRLRGLGYLE